MAYTQHGEPVLGDWVPHPDFIATQSKEGGWTATQSFTILRTTLDTETFQSDFRIGAPIKNLYPEIEAFWEFLGLAQIPHFRHVRGNLTILKARFAGFTGPSGEGTDDTDDEPEPVPTYQLRGGMTERDIMLHPKVLALANRNDRLLLAGIKKGTYMFYDNDDGAGFLLCAAHTDEQAHVTWRPLPGGARNQPTAGDALVFANLIDDGVHTYKFPSFTWEKTWDGTTAINPNEIDNLGFLDVPDGDFPFPGGIDEARDWLLVNATQEQDGLKFRNSLEWELSDRGGWNPDIYE